MQTLLIESLFDDIYMQIRNNILTITCNDLYIIKERFIQNVMNTKATLII